VVVSVASCGFDSIRDGILVNFNVASTLCLVKLVAVTTHCVQRSVPLIGSANDWPDLLI